jgi:mRNA interferase RelE/StbE
VSVYAVTFSRSAARELERLPDKAVQRLVRAIRALQEDPRPRGHRKLVGEERIYRIRVGDYRVVYEVDDDQQTVLITRVRHRKDAYQ